MSCYLVGCDLSSPGHDYIALVEAIEALGERSLECLHSTWLLTSDLTAAEIRDELKPYLGHGDRLVVAEVGRDAAWRGGNKAFSEAMGTVLNASPRSPAL